MISVLIATNDIILERMLYVTLTINGFDIKTANNLTDSQRLLESGKFNFFIIDHDLSEDETYDFCYFIRQGGYQIPILLFGDECSELKKIHVESIPKDALFIDIKNKMNKMLKRRRTLTEKIIQYGDLTIDIPAQIVMFNNKLVNLGKMEFAILVSLARKTGRVVCGKNMRSDLEAQGHFFNMTLYHHIKGLKQKLKDVTGEAFNLKLEVGEGYRLILER